MITLDDKGCLNGIFYNIYDIDSIGIRPQQNLVEALMGGDVFVYDPDNRSFTVSKYLLHDTNSNLFTAPSIIRIFNRGV